MPPVSRKQQRFVYSKASEGVAWAKRWVKQGHNRKVKPKRKRVSSY